MSSIVNKNDIDQSLYELFHKNSIKIEDLLHLLKIRFYDKARYSYPTAFSILDKNTLIICKYISIIKHIDNYIELTHDFIDPENSEYFYLFDQFDEGILSLLHSLLLVRLGYPNQAIGILRRTFETAIMGTFIGLTFFRIKNKNFNPFLSLIESGLWISNITKNLRNNELKDTIEEIGKEFSISKTKSQIRLYKNFSEFYLKKFCMGICNKCKNEGIKNSEDKLPYFTFEDNFTIPCLKCQTATNSVLIQRPISIDLMIQIIKEKLGKNPINLKETYENLSIYLHPNPATHQHKQNFNLKLIREWSKYIIDITEIILWLYMRSLNFLDLLKDEYNNIYLTLEKNDYCLKVISQKEMKKLCIPIDKERKRFIKKYK